jgi:hypothetical protein
MRAMRSLPRFNCTIPCQRLYLFYAVAFIPNNSLPRSIIDDIDVRSLKIRMGNRDTVEIVLIWSDRKKRPLKPW